MGDATQLHQVLLNLAVNARDAMRKRRHADDLRRERHYRSRHTNRSPALSPGFYVVIKVTDTGTGIPREVLDKIFEPFFTTKEMGKGTGLGLATVLGIVKSHGGFVQVQTEVNKGTTFLVYLPALENASAQTETEHREMPRGRGELVLAVDDEASVLTMLRKRWRITDTASSRPKTARKPSPPSPRTKMRSKWSLTDMLMPFMDGPATIRVLRKLDPNVKIIAASGLIDNEKVRDATGMDNIAFLLKPYTAEKLLITLRKVIGEAN